MFCFQCEQTAGCKACTGKTGVCGKPADVALLQDKLTGVLITLAKSNPVRNAALDRQVIEGLFTTVTNVNFSADDAARRIDAVVAATSGDAAPYDMEKVWLAPEDIRTLKSLILFGIRGMAAYAYHALVLGYTDDTVNQFFYRALAAIGDDGADDGILLPLVLQTGEANYHCMALLDKANTETYGHPAPAQVTQTVEPAPFIVVSGHDLRDLHLLLEQTEGKGVNVYTHGEMLPAHGYPAFKKYAHLKGNFGTAWQNQQKEFTDVPAAFLFTTNCLMPPLPSYADRVFTTAVVGYPGLIHIGEEKDFTPVIEKARALGGYPAPHTIHGVNGGGTVQTGFGHNAVLSAAGTVVDAVKSGALKHIFLVGGCDGAKPGRNYFADLVKQTPNDTLVLTLGCGKYRFNDLSLGDVNGLPRLLDMGQCNDAFSAVKTALALADAFGCDVNALPLTLILSWYEQKAVSVLLTLLHLGIKNIHLGPTLPAFVSPAILTFLVEHFGVKPTATVAEDLRSILGTAKK